ncbi:MAG: hypothetical protein ACMUJM_05210 [bacterium]
MHRLLLIFCKVLLCLFPILHTSVLPFAALPSPVFAADNISISGYIKNFSMIFDHPDAFEENNGSRIGSSNNRLRLKLFTKTSDCMAFHLAYDLSPRIQDPSLFQESPYVFSLDPFSYRTKDFDRMIIPEDQDPNVSFGLFHNLDRFFISLSYGFGDIFIGRQAIAWGSGRLVNPTDILAPFSFTDLDQEERFGVDAVRVRVPVGMMNELDGGYVKRAFFIRGKGYWRKTDMALLVMGFKEHALVGADFARSIGGAGAWLEGAYVKPDFFDDSNCPDNASYSRLSLGMDGSLTEKLYGFVEYHFNSAGATAPEEYLDRFSTTAYRDGAVYLMARHYLGMGGTYQLHPLAPLTATLLCNLQDWSFSFSPTIEYNIAQDIYLSAGATLSIGKRAVDTGPSNDPILHSEFGAYPDLYWTSFRVYF